MTGWNKIGREEIGVNLQRGRRLVTDPHEGMKESDCLTDEEDKTKSFQD